MIVSEGRPHPMIDPTSRITRILQEAKDPEVAVLALDFELGYGSHENPVGVLAEALKEAKAIAKADGRVSHYWLCFRDRRRSTRYS